MRRSTIIKVGILLAGIILVVFSRLLGSREFTLISIGVVLIIIGVVTFFVGGEKEEDIEQEEL